MSRRPRRLVRTRTSPHRVFRDKIVGPSREQVHPLTAATQITYTAEPIGDPERKNPRWERARGAGPGPLSAPGRAARGRADQPAQHGAAVSIHGGYCTGDC